MVTSQTAYYTTEYERKPNETITSRDELWYNTGHCADALS
jgi:hypothetical protein